jgi:CheY-like chemotaxis protein
MHSQPLELACQPSCDATAKRVLIVDDDDAAADVLGMRLSRQGFRTSIAENGQMARALVRSERPNVILLDLRLPDVDGFELCQELVDSPQTSHIPVIVVSGLDRPDIVRRARAAGCHYYVRKPYDPNALLTLIQQAIDEADGA